MAAMDPRVHTHDMTYSIWPFLYMQKSEDITPPYIHDIQLFGLINGCRKQCLEDAQTCIYMCVGDDGTFQQWPLWGSDPTEW